MLSALKKKLGSSNPGGASDSSKIPSGINVVSAELQRKFAHGVNFNMKIVIRGDRNSGKTCLWNRIQGKPFSEIYNPTEEIQAANIVWNYKARDHIVKLDVWDVVDESPKRRIKLEGLKLDNKEISKFESPACDAGFVDVYKNCNGVLMIFDITKPWTWNYVERELEKIPSNIPVLILSNKVDLESQRQVREDDVQYFLKNFKRNPPPPGKMLAQIRYTQSSMKNAYGLKYLYNFLNIPFLFLQRETLEGMLEANKREIELSYQEMDLVNSEKDESGDEYSNQPENGSNNDVFSTETKKAAISGTTQVNQGNSEFQNRRKLSSSSSEDHGNKMVDMFEEDFNSADEDIHLEVYSKKIEKAIERPSDIKMKHETPSGDFSKSSTVNATSSPTPVDPLKTPIGPVKGPSLDLDAWLDASPDLEKKISSEMKSSDEERSNPLVTPLEGDSEDEETIKSTEGSISAGSNLGFSVLPKKSPNEEALKKPKLEKKKKDTKKKKKIKNKTGRDNILVEDIISPQDTEQYESL